MRLRHLLESVSASTICGPVDVEISDIVYDSRMASTGSLFVAMPSVSTRAGEGGNLYAQQAVDCGARAVVSESPLTVPGVTMIQVTDARAALADLAAQFFGRPSGALRLFAVTGTDGKTTTTYLLEQILAHAGFCTGLIGTVEIKVGEDRYRNLDRMTTPEAVDVQRLLRRMVDAGVTHVALEASSHALALQRLRNCTISVAGVTNITSDHIEFHGSPEAYFAAKASLFSNLGRNRPAILNRDDASFLRLAAAATGPITTYGLTPDADVYANDVRTDVNGSTFTLHACGENVPVHLPLPGRFNVSNSLAAAAMALRSDVELATVAAGLSHATPPPGRMQRIAGGAPFNLVVDYAHTVNAFETVLATLREQTPSSHRLIAVFGATGDRDRAKRPVLARVARQYTDFFIITNEDPYRETPDAIIREVAAGVPGSERGLHFDTEPDRGRAIGHAIDIARPGDTIVVLGKGHEQSMVVDGRKVPWSDVLSIQQALEARR
ncbi:MAG: UDP-N-acetylmuramoyl-L-alanyl-D-glutamate--2,6-diaminopimelate ligase [Chloroflexota bacterium]